MQWRLPLDVLVVRPDGRRLLSLRLTPATLCVALILPVLTAAAGSLAILAPRWHVAAATASTAPPVVPVSLLLDEQRELVDVVQRRVGEINAELTAWHEAQATLRKDLQLRQTPLPEAPEPLPEESLTARAMLATQLEHVLTTVRAETKSLRGLQPLVGRAMRALAALPSRWPVRAVVSSEFGERHSPFSGEPEFHGGIDIAAHAGSRVVAPSAGRVVFVGATPDYGNTVVLDHGNAIRTRFGHLERVIVKAGQHVDRGQPVALSGSTGRSTAPHLHYEILVQGRRVNPRQYLRE